MGRKFKIQLENITMDLEHEEWYSNDGKILAKPKNEKIPVAKIVHAELRPQGVWVKAQINTNLRSFNELWGSIKDGFLKAFSVAFYPIQKTGNIIKSLNLVNVTLTGSPVNPNAAP
jgi:phage head maturation protease